ncbi:MULTISPECIES: hypothetical protein [unclassified Parabacteroides]|uniref:hypothetical protein n=1 Tax=unclassified Parabacteroides TaxID=2649774 RepID=UPI0013D89D8B|nr:MULTISPECIES: hypothetical protein [unclassified Parabacteroides]
MFEVIINSYPDNRIGRMFLIVSILGLCKQEAPVGMLAGRQSLGFNILLQYPEGTVGMCIHKPFCPV